MPTTSSKTVRVNNSNGLHARIAASIAALARLFEEKWQAREHVPHT